MKIKVTSYVLLLALLAFGAPAWAAKVEICHLDSYTPNQTVSNGHNITISEYALPAHLAHGDFLGDCNAISACPCRFIPQFNILLLNANFCYGSSESLAVSIDPITETSTPALALANSSSATDPVCEYLDSKTAIVIPNTNDEADACFQAISDAAASRGLSCISG
jgi:hypothetical protein